MPSSENRIIVACAGSGKTTRLVNEALASRDRRIAFVTYTNNNTREIKKKFGELNSGIPKHVDVMTWFAFLLRECARPYQKSKYTEQRVESIFFVNEQSARRIAELNIKHHYFAQGRFIYSDKLSKFACKCEESSNLRVTARLKQIYSDIFIDEFQDLAGWDLDFVEQLLRSGIRITLVGDPRQHIYSTNPSSKNSQYLGLNVLDLIQIWQKKGLCNIDPPMCESYRCNQPICDFANRLWPGMESMKSIATTAAAHAGIFMVAEKLVDHYIRQHSPQILRYDKRAQTYGCHALNFGLSKGLEFDHVLIIPTVPIKKYLQTGDLQHLKSSKDKIHVAVTRALHSVAFVYSGQSPIDFTKYSA